MYKKTDYSFKCRPKDVDIGRILDEADKDAVGIIIVGTRRSCVCLRIDFLRSFSIDDKIEVGGENLSVAWGSTVDDSALRSLFNTTKPGEMKYNGWWRRLHDLRDVASLVKDIERAKEFLKDNNKVRTNVLSL